MQGEFVRSTEEGDLLLIRVTFNHDLSAAEQERAATELVDSAAKPVRHSPEGRRRNPPVAVVDLEGVEVAYSRFLGALLSIRGDWRRRGGRVVLAAVRPSVVKVLEQCALTVLFELFPTVEAAWEAVRSHPGGNPP